MAETRCGGTDEDQAPVLPLVHLPGRSLQVVDLLAGFKPDVFQLFSQLGLVL